MAVTRERAMELLAYDPETGVVTWRIFHSPRATAGKEVTRINHAGYYRVSIDHQQLLLHRVIWLMVTGAWPDACIDHINGDRRDNRLRNLRQATRAENGQNRGLGKRNKSGLQGVSWNKQAGNWKAQIGHEGRHWFIGNFSTKEEAYDAYLAEKARVHTFNPVPREGMLNG